MRTPFETNNRRRIALIAIAAVLTVVTIVWFATFPRGIVMGDDMRLIYGAQHGGYASSPLTSLWQTVLDKYRPVMTLIYSIVIPLFGLNFAAYQVLNILIELADTALVGHLAWRVSGRNVALATCAAIAFLFSRFEFFAVLQIGAYDEGIALGLMLLVLYDAVRAYESGTLAPYKRALLWFALMIFSDERFIVVFPFLTACILLQRTTGSEARLARGLAAGPAAILLANYCLKQFILHTVFLQGTAGQKIGFDPPQITHFFLLGLANVLGFNVGPDYLVGADVSELGAIGYLLGAMVAIPTIAGATAYAVAARSGRAANWQRNTLLAASLLLPLLLSASITIRQEARWLYASWALLLIMLAGVASLFRPNDRRVYAMAGVFVVGAVGGTLQVRANIDNVFYTYSMNIASTVRDTLTRDKRLHATIVTHGDSAWQGWVFMDGEFFSEFLPNVAVTYVTDVKDAPKVADSDVFDIRGTTVKVAKWSSEIATPHTAPFTVASFSFVNRFANGKINSDAHVDTPTGRGALVMAWPAAGSPERSLTVVAPFRYSYLGLRVNPTDELGFDVARPYAGGPTRAFIDVTDRRQTTRIFHEDLPAPAVPGIRLTWERRYVKLGRFSGRSITVTFGADAGTSDPTATWAAFGEPGIGHTKRP